MEAITNATPIETTVTATYAHIDAAFTAYVAHTNAVVQAQQQVSGKAAYAVQGLLIDGKDVTPEQQAVYNAFVQQVQAATDACMQVKGKATACGIFNYLDGRVTGYKVATALGNSVSLRTFIANVAILAQRAITATPAGEHKGNKNKGKGNVAAQAATA